MAVTVCLMLQEMLLPPAVHPADHPLPAPARQAIIGWITAGVCLTRQPILPPVVAQLLRRHHQLQQQLNLNLRPANLHPAPQLQQSPRLRRHRVNRRLTQAHQLPANLRRRSKVFVWIIVIRQLRLRRLIYS